MMRVRSIVAALLFSIGFVVHAQEPDLEVRGRRAALPRAGGEQRDPATASDGRDFITVWPDTRAGERQRDIWGNREGGGAQIFMNIVRRDGMAVSPYGIRISGAMHYCAKPAVVWSGHHYVVAWQHAEYRGDSAVSIIRVSADGTLLDAEPRRVFTGNGAYPLYPMLAASSRGVVLGVRAIDVLHFAAIGEDGAPYAERSVIVSVNGAALVATGDSFLVFEPAGRPRTYLTDLYAYPLTIADGRIDLGAKRLMAEEVNPWSLAAASRGGAILFAYRHNDTRLRTRMLSADGHLSEESEHGAAEDAVSLTATRSGFVMVWSTVAGYVRNPVYGTRSIGTQYVPPPLTLTTYDMAAATFDGDGRVRDTFKLIEGGESDELPAVASNGAQFLVSWLERSIRAPIGLKIAAALSSGGAAMERVAVAHSRPRQQTPEIAAGTDGYLVVWAEELENDGVRSIFAQRFDRDGRALQTARVIGGDAFDQYAPKVAFNGEVFLVIWVEDSPRRIVGRRIATDGSMLDEHPLVIAQGNIGGPPSLASNGRDFTVAYGSMYGDMRRDEQTVQLVRIDRAFAVSPPVALFPREASIDSEIVIAASGDDYVVAWQ